MPKFDLNIESLEKLVRSSSVLGAKMSAAGSEGIGPKKIGPETYE